MAGDGLQPPTTYGLKPPFANDITYSTHGQHTLSTTRRNSLAYLHSVNITSVYVHFDLLILDCAQM